MNRDGSQGFQNATQLLPLPQGKKGATLYREHMQSCLLGCIVSLAAPVSADAVALGEKPNEPTPIGTIALTSAEMARVHHRKTSIGINLSSQYQGQGYGSEAILWVLEWAFRHANMHRVGIAASSYNEGAVRLYQRLGFVLEGRAREDVWYNGAYHDSVELGMLDREWWEKYGAKDN